MACCVLVAMIIARVRQLLGFGAPQRNAASPSARGFGGRVARTTGPSLVVLLGLAGAEFGLAWAIARGLTDPMHRQMPVMAGPSSHLAVMAQLTVLGVLAPLLVAWL